MLHQTVFVFPLKEIIDHYSFLALSWHQIWQTSRFWPRVRARALRAPVFLVSLTRHMGRCAPPPPIAASLLLIQPPKINKIYQTRAARVKGFPEIKCFPSGSNLDFPRQGFFLSTGPQRLWNMRSPAPRPAHRSFADPSGNILGSKLCTGATFYSNLLILLVLSLLIVLLLYLNLFVV